MASKTKQAARSLSSNNGQLPKGWRMVRFGDVVRDVKESEKNPLDAGLERYVGLEHIEPENLHLKQWGDLTQDEVSFTKRFRKGQVLFGKRRAYQRKVAVAEFDGICSSDILTFEPKDDELLPDLLPFIVQSDPFFEHALGTSSGSLSPRTRWSQLKDFEFPLPPKNEQRRIAEILAGAENYIEKCKLTLRDMELLRVSVMEFLLVKGFDNEKRKPSEIGDVPESWKVKTLGELCELKNGHGFRVADWDTEGLPIIRIQNLNGSRQFNYYSGEVEDKWVIEPGELLYSWAGVKGISFGPCLWTGPRGVLNQHIYRVVPNDGVEKRWMHETLKMITHRIEKRAHGFKLELVHVRKSQITDQLIAVPPNRDQKRICNYAQQFETLVTQWRQRIAQTRELKAQLINELLGDQPNVQ